VGRPLVLLCSVVLLAGCGGGSHPPAAPKAKAKPCPAHVRALKKIDADLAALKTAGRAHVKDTLLGGPAANHATDTFLLDLETLSFTRLEMNRLIDHAAASVVGSCQQCFQALEAERPIPALAHDGPGACAKKP
jgi:hypothetical protein